ncbi:MAG: RNHCP domain-containing protein [Christensenellaceae bacterium]|jgi:DNA-directed RNA polymerase subunit RPC12/RpoP|nr:RNHCP domain-containing protein [Christensenellaceae bacterium]
MEQKRFRKRDEGFVCQNCGLEVLPLGESSRNHCPRCLYSLHVDLNPGDRQNPCGGKMAPVATEFKGGEYILTHRCEKCGALKRNKAFPYARTQPDSIDELIRVSARAF